MQQGLRLSSTNTPVNAKAFQEANEKKSRVVLSDDGRVIVAWHPEIPFPYELTKPLPAETLPTDSVLKVQALMPPKEVFRHKHQDIMLNELMALTHTPKYTWFPKKRRLRMAEMVPNKETRYRKYL